MMLKKMAARCAGATILILLAGPLLAQNVLPRYELGAGDLISVSFFANPDLSGDIRVRADATIVIHQIGVISVAERTEAELQAELSDRARVVFDRDVSVTVGAIEMRPVYVMGEVETPGVYPFRAELTAQQAVAIAGGWRRTQTENTGIVLRVETERQRVLSARAELGQVRALVARLQAEQARTQAGTDVAALKADFQDFGALEAALVLGREQLDAALRASGIEAQGLAEQEAALLERRRLLLDEQIAVLEAALGRVQDLRERGLVPTDQLDNAQNNLADVRSLALESEALVFNARRAATLAAASVASLDLERDFDLAEELLAARRQEALLRTQLLASSEFLAKNGATVPGETQTDVQRIWVLYRMSGTGETLRLDVNNATHLLPGDTLEISYVYPDIDDS